MPSVWPVTRKTAPSIPAGSPLRSLKKPSSSFFAWVGRFDELKPKLAPSFISITKRRSNRRLASAFSALSVFASTCPIRPSNWPSFPSAPAMAADLAFRLVQTSLVLRNPPRHWIHLFAHPIACCQATLHQGESRQHPDRREN